MNSIQVGLAPMEGVTDLATRLWFALTYPPDFATTPFLRVTTNLPTKKIPMAFCPQIEKGLLPFEVVPQIMGTEPADMARIGEYFCNKFGSVEINCGCPSPKVVGHGAGSGLLENLSHFSNYLGSLSKHLGSKCIAVKIRTGCSDPSSFSSILEHVKEVDPLRLTIHGRTRDQGYQGCADWGLIEKASREMKIPVVGSGDIVDLQSLFDKAGARPKIGRVIVGRGALRNPWIFQEIKYHKTVILPHEALKKSLIVYCLLLETFSNNPETLIEMVKEGRFQEANKDSTESWGRWLVSAQQRIGLRKHWYEDNNWKLSRSTLGRFKLLWNYLRSGLPSSFSAPEFFRIKTLREFLTQLDRCAAGISRHRSGAEYLSKFSYQLTHKKEMDWIYQGAKRQ